MNKVERPWGWYETIHEGDRLKIKNIEEIKFNLVL